MQIINHSVHPMLCVCDQVLLHMCTCCMGSLLWVHLQHIPWGRGRGTPYMHNLTTHHTSPPTNCPHHTHTTLPHWPHLPTFHAPLTLPPLTDESLHLVWVARKMQVLTFSEVWWPGHAYGVSHMHGWHSYCTTRTWLQRLAITGGGVAVLLS